MQSEDTGKRIRRHPVIDPSAAPEGDRRVLFRFNGREIVGLAGEAVSSALFANGIQVFGHHAKDGGAQGIYCANGQCAQCTLIIDGVPLKSCIVPLQEGMEVQSLEGLPVLRDEPPPDVPAPEVIETDVLILGAGPAGMAAAIELGEAGLGTLLVDDKDRMGGKLVLQTHKFFGSVSDCHAGTRGVDIAAILARQIAQLPSVDVWLEAIVLAVFSDQRIGVRTSSGYKIVKPKYLLVSAGAREKALTFPGNDLPGVYGAGAFQTLVNRDLVRAAERIFVLGGGNVGLIAAYHALQADMTVVGLAEALPVCGGYKVHADKILRLGVPIFTRHTVLAAHGTERLEAVTMAAIDDQFRPILGTERTFRVDTLLVAVGLNPVNEFYEKAKSFGLPVAMAGDSEEIAEASAAMFSGKIRGREIARALGADVDEAAADWEEMAEILKSPGGEIHPYEVPEATAGTYPVLHCSQEIPCNPCMTICPKDLIDTRGHPILGLPEFAGVCVGCEKCVGICPGLAVTLVEWPTEGGAPIVTIPFELGQWRLPQDEPLTVTGITGEVLGTGNIVKVRKAPGARDTLLVRVEVNSEIANHVVGIRIQDPATIAPEPEDRAGPAPDDAICCRCERVTAGEIRAVLRSGVRDLNELKVATRAGFGACGGKTCRALIERICREEGLEPAEITPFTERPLFAETRLGIFAGRKPK